MKRNRTIPFGPSVPFVPNKDFTKLRLTRDQISDAWEIVGPSVDRNKRRCTETWELITLAYLEGLLHGSELERERS